ncbi:MAG TPA: hypothetical protein VHP37_24965 [Burkholderiales bacterium]|nr:hypothetical protein [Burkholderiales bacterium]
MTTTGFSALAKHTGKAFGADALRVAEYAGPLGIHDADTLRRNISEGLVERIVDALTAPLEATVSEKSAEALNGTPEEIEAHFRAKGWTDGLPFVAPTIERIEAFLRHTPRASDEQIALLPSANLRATPRNIAANAVMAGCRPEHMPLLVAAVEALADERCSLDNLGSSSGIVPFAIVNGPMAKALDIAGGPQAISRGANPAIGRALGLIVRNIAGFRPGASYMGTFGYILPFVLAENEDESPWEPFHVTHGFPPDASTVTIGVTNNWGSSPAPYDTADLSGADVALELIGREVTKKTRLFNFPAIGDDAEHVMVTVLMSPPVAKSLAAAGYSKRAVQEHVYEHARMRLADFDWMLKYTATMRTTARERVEAGVLPLEFAGNPDDPVRVLSSPDLVHVIVCGDPGRNRLMVMEGGHTRPTTRVIVPARLP